MSPSRRRFSKRFGLVLVEHEAELRQGLADLLHHAGQQVRPDGGNQADLEFAGKRIGVVAGERNDLVALIEHAPRTHHDLLADLGELHVLRLALDQFDAEIFLELLELCGEGRLTHERALRGPAEMAGIRQRHQVFQVLEIHRRQPHLVDRGSLSNLSIESISIMGVPLASCAPGTEIQSRGDSACL